MDEVNALQNINYWVIFTSLVVIVLAFKFVIELGGWFLNFLGVEFKWVRKKKENKEILYKTKESLEGLTKRFDTLESLVIRKQIKDYRRDILEFCASLSSGKGYNREAYTNIFETYEDYEDILKANNMSNGQVETSMEYIRRKYQEDLDKGII